MALLNEGGWDRAVRVIFGAGLVYAARTGAVSAGWPTWLLIVAGGMALFSGITGWCPAYTLAGFSSKRRDSSRCQSPKTE